LIEPLLQNKKILDLFCGTNSIKQFSIQNHTKTCVTGVDNSETNKFCDIRSNVINLPKVLKPQFHFDIITSFGGTNSENYSDNYDYLKKDGLLIHGYSKQFFKDNNIESQLICDKTKKNKNINELLKYFQPIVIININGIHQIINWPSQNKPIDLIADMTYLIFQKRRNKKVLAKYL
jgi:hypothetical protein